MAKIEVSSKEIPQVLKMMEQMVPGLKLDAIEKMVEGVTFDSQSLKINKTLADKTVVTIEFKFTP